MKHRKKRSGKHDRKNLTQRKKVSFEVSSTGVKRKKKKKQTPSLPTGGGKTRDGHGEESKRIREKEKNERPCQPLAGKGETGRGVNPQS